MRTTLLLILAIFLFSTTAHSQSSNRNYVGLSIGPSFPLGNFAKTNFSDSTTSGWAKTGVAVNFDYAYRLTHNFGVMGIISYSSNGFNNVQYKDSLNAAHPDTSFSVEGVTSWSTGGIMIGPYLRFPLGDNLSWDIRGVFGVYGGTTPKITIRATDDQTGEELDPYTRQSAKAYNFSFLIGTGFKYRLSNYYILLFGDYLNTTLKFDDFYEYDIDNEPKQVSYNQKIEYFSVTIGLGYYF